MTRRFLYLMAGILAGYGVLIMIFGHDPASVALMMSCAGGVVVLAEDDRRRGPKACSKRQSAPDA